MHLNGTMRMSKMNKLILLLLFPSIVYSQQDSSQYLSGDEFFKEIEAYNNQSFDNEELDKTLLNKKVKVEKKTDFKKEDLLKGDATSNSFDPSSTGGAPVTMSDEIVLSAKRRQAKTNFGFNYYLSGETKFENDSGVFKKTFQDDPESIHIGPLILSWEKLLSKGVIVPFINFNTGLNYFRGRGVFAGDGTYSNAFFNLWMVPFELGLGLGLRPWDFF